MKLPTNSPEDPKKEIEVAHGGVGIHVLAPIAFARAHETSGRRAGILPGNSARYIIG